MSSFGHVLDLLDDRFLNLQDVFGNVAPFPTLVPYDQYGRTVEVYRMDHSHEVFMTLIQDYTDRHTSLSGKEAWTWWVQWEVAPSEDMPETPNAKKPRLDSISNARKPANIDAKATTKLKAVRRRVLRPEIFHSDEMHRILVDIVTVRSAILPNYVEFLYQWIDYHLGDGKALHAAVRHEIPSLWLYEDHPRPLAKGESTGDQEDDHLQEASAAIKQGNERKKPDINALELQTEQSERMKYHEVKFGLQRPIDPNNEPFTPLINIPTDPEARKKYFAACFKNRQRALWLLQEVGITAKQIANYRIGQKEPLIETREDMNGDGFHWYYHDVPFANEHRALQESKLRQKQLEIALSNQLAEEARRASSHGHSNALPPPAPSYPNRRRFQELLEKLMKDAYANHYQEVPASIHGFLKSKLFAKSKPVQRNGLPQTLPSHPHNENDGNMSARSDDDGDSNGGDGHSSPDDNDDDGNGGPGQEDAGPVNGNGDAMDTSPTSPFLHTPSTLANSSTNVQPINPQGSTLNPAVPATGQHQFIGSFYASVFPEVVTGQSSGNPSEWRPPSLFEMGPSQGLAFPTTHNRPLDIQSNSALNSQHFLETTPYETQSATQMNTLTLQQSSGPATTYYGDYGVSATQFNPPPFQQTTTYHGSHGGGEADSQTYALYHPSPNPFAPTMGSQNGGSVQLNHSPFLSTPAPAEAYPGAQGSITQSSPASMLNPFASAASPVNAIGSNPFQSTTPSGSNHFLAANPNPALLQSAARAPPPAPLNLQNQNVHPYQAFNMIQNGNRAALSPHLMTPLANLAGGLTLASPRAAPTLVAPPTAPDVPILIYFPKVVLSQEEVISTPSTDCFLLGHTRPGSRRLILSKAIFLPADMSDLILDRVHKHHLRTVETYPSPRNHPAAPKAKRPGLPREFANTPDEIRGVHRIAYGKVLQAYNLMTQCDDREQDLTKRWRISKGPMTDRERGSVWEGWGVYVDRGIEMVEEERKGAIQYQRIDPVRMDDPEEAYEEMRRLEIEEMIEEDEREQERLATEEHERRVREEEAMLLWLATGEMPTHH